jgi:hypothetical protein
MRNLIKIFLVFALAIIVVSCENEIEFNGNELQSMMVINGFVSPDSVVKVHVSKSKFFLEDDTNFDNITDAIVQLWVNDELKGEMQNSGNGYYISNYTPSANDKIKVTASSDIFKNVNCSVEIPRATPVLAVDTTEKTYNKYSTEIYRYDETTGEVVTHTAVYRNFTVMAQVAFHDSLNYDNYYLLKVNSRKTYTDGSIRLSECYINSDDIVFGSNSDDAAGVLVEDVYNQFYEFNDELINGKTYKLSFSLPVSALVSEIDETGKEVIDDYTNYYRPVKSELVIQLYSITKSFYLYLRTIEASGNSSGFLSEPVQVYTNVIGGIGILGGYNVYTKTIELPVNYEINGFYY